MYFALPYANFGTEARYNNFYARAHYDALLPLFFFFNANDLDAIHFWGFDIGFIIPFNNGQGIELEYNLKTKNGFSFSYISISFAAY